MKNSIGKKIVSLALLGATTSLMALYAEHASLYKDPRVMGMGGASVAVGAYSTSVFSNPAGLANIKKEHGFVVDLLGIGVSATAEIQDFMDDIDGVDTDGDSAASDMLDILKKYNGKPFHIGFDNYTSISKNSDGLAWTIGILAAGDTNYMSHSNGGVGLLETSSRVYGGVVLGAAKPFETEYGRLDVGMSFKYIKQQSYEGALGISDLLSDDMETEIQDKFEKKSTGFGVDLGVTYHPWVDNVWHAAFGMSIMNIGSMDMDNNYGKQPTTVNFGASITPEVSFMNKLVVAIDYVDFLDANKLRWYSVAEDGSVSWTDYSESEIMKRLRLGVGMGLFDTTYASGALNLGLYQGAYTAGLNFELLLLKLNFATYEEEIGNSSTSVTDRRYMAQIGIGW